MTPKNKRIDCGRIRRAFVRLRICRVSRVAFAASTPGSNQASSHRTQSYTEYATEFHREKVSIFWRFALMTDAPAKAPCARRHLPPLCETLWHTLCNSVTDGFLLDCYLLDCCAAARTHNRTLPTPVQGSTVKRQFPRLALNSILNPQPLLVVRVPSSQPPLPDTFFHAHAQDRAHRGGVRADDPRLLHLRVASVVIPQNPLQDLALV